MRKYILINKCMFMTRGSCTSDYFYIFQGVNQGVSWVLDYLVKSQIGCQIDRLCVNHIVYRSAHLTVHPPPQLQEKTKFSDNKNVSVPKNACHQNSFE